jgi:hypothetical protein
MIRTLARISKLSLSVGAMMVTGAVVGGASQAQAAESKTFVVGWFSEATYSQEEDCVGGINPGIDQQYLKNLGDLGYTPAQIEEMAKTELDGGENGGKVRGIMTSRARVDGKPANPYAYPAFVVDPKLKASVSKKAYGFNLDGKGMEAANAAEDPETHEKGVDNEFSRALGCMRSFRGSLEGRPTYFAWAWGQLKDSMPAWLVTISGESLSKDGDVTVTFDRALEHLRSNADGSPRADATYRVDPDPRSHNVVHGKLKGNVLTFEKSFDFRMLQNPLVAPMEFKLSRAQLRMKLKDDGSIDGIIGGYLPWSDFYVGLGVQGPGTEYCIAGDIPGIYYLLKKHADADPDPKTGQNMSISAAYYLEAVPAFVAQADKRVSSAR